MIANHSLVTLYAFDSGFLLIRKVHFVFKFIYILWKARIYLLSVVESDLNFLYNFSFPTKNMVQIHVLGWQSHPVNYVWFNMVDIWEVV